MPFKLWDNPEQAIEGIKKSESLEAIRGHFSRLFNLGDDAKLRNRMAIADAMMVAIEQAKNAEQNSLEAISAKSSFYQLWGSHKEALEDFGFDTPEKEYDIQKVVKSKAGLENIVESFAGIGKWLIAEFPEMLRPKVDILKSMRIPGIKSEIAEKSNQIKLPFQYERRSVLKPKSGKLKTINIEKH